MSDAPAGLFVDADLATSIEAAERSLIEQCAEAGLAAGDRSFVLPIGGGAAVWAEPGSPFNKVVGAGFAGATDDTELDDIEAAYAELGAPVQFELSSLADPALVDQLSRRGFVIAGFENVLGVELRNDRRPAMADDVAVAEVAADDITGLEAWVHLDVEGSLAADGSGTAAHEQFDAEEILRAQRAMSRTTGFRAFTARLGGEAAGTGAMRIAGDITQLCGASTLPRFRRRGVQSSVLAVRLAAAAAAGCRLAVVTVQPGSTSQRNVQRHGFQLLYVRVILVKPPPA